MSAKSDRNPKSRNQTSSQRSKRRLGLAQSNPLDFQRLEDRNLLATITVTNATDLTNADTSSITALMANDGGDGISLREAIVATNNTVGDDSITFDGSVFTGGANSLIRLTQGELDITETLTIDGSTGTDIVITGDRLGDDVTLAGKFITDVLASNDLLDDNRRVFVSVSADMLSIINLTITGGRTTFERGAGAGVFAGNVSLVGSTLSGNSTAGFAASGGGIATDSGDITVVDSILSGNSTSGRTARAGGIYTRSGNVTLTNSSVTDNSTFSNQRYANDYASGGGIYTRSGSVTLTNSTLSGNQTLGSRSNGGGIATDSGNVLLTNSEVSGNSTSGFNSPGGGIYTDSGSVSLINSTVSANSTSSDDSEGGGIVSGHVSLTNSTVNGNSTSGSDSEGGGISAAYVSLTNSTVSGNSTSGFGSEGGGIISSYVSLTSSTVTGNSSNRRAGGGVVYSRGLTLVNSIVAGNTDDDGDAPDLQGPRYGRTSVVSHSLIGDTTGSYITSTTGVGNILNESALLGPLTDNGGPTLTHALLPGSPAVNTGRNSLAVDSDGSPLLSDQRGGGYDRIKFGTIDIGAFELGGVEPDPEVNRLVVNTTLDDIDPFDGLTSLREAIAFSNGTAGHDTITFDPAVFSGGVSSLIRLMQGDLEITEEVTIDGDSGTDVTISGDRDGDDVTLAGTFITDVSASYGGVAGDANDLLDDNSRILRFSSTTEDLTLTGLTLTGGRTVGRDERGGGIRFDSSGTLFLRSSDVSGNSANGYAVRGGGIYTSSGDVSLFNSSFIGNSSTSSVWRPIGGGISTYSGNVSAVDSILGGNSADGRSARGGGIGTHTGSILLSGSTLYGNTASGVSSSGGAISSREGIVSLINSTLRENSASRDGGAVVADSGVVSVLNSTLSGNSAARNGGAIFTTRGVVSFINSTASGNNSYGSVSADGGGAIWATLNSTVRIVNSTLVGNSASSVGGAISFRDSNNRLVIANSIVAGNTDNGTAPDVASEFTEDLSVKHSLIGDTTGSGVTESTGNRNILNQPAILGPLADNGGPTMTHALLAGSPAIDAGSNTLVVGFDGVRLTTDQRGDGFDRIKFGRVDIGAFESDFDAPPIAPSVLSTTIDEGGVLARPDLWNTLTVVFDADVTVASEDLSLFNDSLGGTEVDLTGIGFNYDSTANAATWDFSTLDPLEAAFYSYRLDAASIAIAGDGLALDGDVDGTGGDDFVQQHYVAIPGDANLDGVVDVLNDAFILVGNLGTTTDLAFTGGNFNGDDQVDVLSDAFLLVGNLNRDVRPPATAAAFASSAIATDQLRSVSAANGSVSVAVTLGQSSEDDDRGESANERNVTASQTESPQLVLAGDHDLRDDVFGSDF